jgi:ABC-2 type transport system permease protein
MLADALRAELFKLLRNRTTLFWAFGFVPLATLAIGLYLATQLRGALPPGLVVPAPDLGVAFIRGLSEAANPFAVLFALIGAAMLFAGEFRWETWRLIATRNSRVLVFTAKLLVFALACAATVALTGIAGLLAAAAEALSHGAGMRFTADPGDILRAFAVSELRLLQVGAVAALIAVVSRSMMAAAIGPAGLLLAQFVAQTQLLPRQAQAIELHHLLAFPGAAFDILDAANLQPDSPQGALALQAALAAAVWIVGGAAAALVLLARLDLAKE